MSNATFSMMAACALAVMPIYSVVAQLVDSSSPVVDAAGLAMEADDECHGEDGCALNALQLRVGLSAATTSNENASYGCEDDRESRLKQYGTRTLYHQTSPKDGRNIMETGFDVSWAKANVKKDIAGPGTYFATTLWATNKKAHSFGFCIRAEVYTGRWKDEPRHPGWNTLQSLNSQCYDSVHINRGYKGGDEFVIYANDQMPKSLYTVVKCPSRGGDSRRRRYYDSRRRYYDSRRRRYY